MASDHPFDSAWMNCGADALLGAANPGRFENINKLVTDVLAWEPWPLTSFVLRAKRPAAPAATGQLSTLALLTVESQHSDGLLPCLRQPGSLCGRMHASMADIPCEFGALRNAGLDVFGRIDKSEGIAGEVSAGAVVTPWHSSQEKGPPAVFPAPPARVALHAWAASDVLTSAGGWSWASASCGQAMLQFQNTTATFKAATGGGGLRPNYAVCTVLTTPLPQHLPYLSTGAELLVPTAGISKWWESRFSVGARIQDNPSEANFQASRSMCVATNSTGTISASAAVRFPVDIQEEKPIFISGAAQFTTHMASLVSSLSVGVRLDAPGQGSLVMKVVEHGSTPMRCYAQASLQVSPVATVGLSASHMSGGSATFGIRGEIQL